MVIDRKVDEGQTVAAQFQAPELFVIARDLSKMQVKAEVSEADIGRVVQGAPVKFSVDAYPGKEFNGSVVQVRSAPDKEENSTSNVVVYGVLVNAENPEKLLKPGMTATVEILAEKLENALVIPSQALRYIPAAEGEKDNDGKGGKERVVAKASPVLVRLPRPPLQVHQLLVPRTLPRRKKKNWPPAPAKASSGFWLMGNPCPGTWSRESPPEMAWFWCRERSKRAMR